IEASLDQEGLVSDQRQIERRRRRGVILSTMLTGADSNVGIVTHESHPERQGDRAGTPEGRSSTRNDHKPRVVIVGGGFGGLAAAKALKNSPVQVLLVDRTNHHLFQPLLYQVAISVLTPGQIASPIRAILRNQKNTTVILGEVTGVDKDRRCV